MWLTPIRCFSRIACGAAATPPSGGENGREEPARQLCGQQPVQFLVNTVGLRLGASPVQGWNLFTGTISGRPSPQTESSTPRPVKHRNSRLDYICSTRCRVVPTVRLRCDAHRAALAPIDTRAQTLDRRADCAGSAPPRWGPTHKGPLRLRCKGCRRSVSAATGTLLSRIRLPDNLQQVGAETVGPAPPRSTARRCVRHSSVMISHRHEAYWTRFAKNFGRIVHRDDWTGACTSEKVYN